MEALKGSPPQTKKGDPFPCLMHGEEEWYFTQQVSSHLEVIGTSLDISTGKHLQYSHLLLTILFMISSLTYGILVLNVCVVMQETWVA